MNKKMYVYIMTNLHRTTLYVGVTNDLLTRVCQHKLGNKSSFTSKYKLQNLVYFEKLDSPRSAINREKQLKDWKRGWKLDLIRSINPSFKDLSESVLGITDSEIRDLGKT